MSLYSADELSSATKKSWDSSSKKPLLERKIKAFETGTINLPIRGKTKKEQEERKELDKQRETVEIYKEFVDSFDVTKSQDKAWIKGETVVHGADKHKEVGSTKGKLYKPTSRYAKFLKQQRPDSAEEKVAAKPPSIGRKKEKEKRKSNLELFKEELKVIQEERQERRAARSGIRKAEDSGRTSQPTESEPPANWPERKSRFEPISNIIEDMTYENDLNTTNLYLGNLNPSTKEQALMELFGKYGPLASVKIMWPRSQEEHSRGSHCGFVAFMNRKDGERALAALRGKVINGFEMRMGWGKSVPIPPHPIYIPPKLIELTLPPPPSGLPFNAQKGGGLSKLLRENTPKGQQWPSPDSPVFDELLSKCVIKVVIPTERTLLCIIHRMIEFVVREGPLFEAMIMNREMHNPLFRFLFENNSAAHIYYRWKLFSILQGDGPNKWRIKPFRMFKNGSIFKPPPMNPYLHGMPDDLVDDPDRSISPALRDEKDAEKGEGDSKNSSESGKKDKKRERDRTELTDAQRDRLESLLRELTVSRNKVGHCMVWCLEHAICSKEIVSCIAESLCIAETPLQKKLARLYLVSDILHNAGSARVSHSTLFRYAFEEKLVDIMIGLKNAHESIPLRWKAEQFRQRVLSCLAAWENWSIYSADFLIKLQNLFLGLISEKEESKSPEGVRLLNEDVDGAPLNSGLDISADVDGIPMDDVDGVPLENTEGINDAGKAEQKADYLSKGNSEEMSSKTKKEGGGGFKKTTWETVDPTLIEHQAMTTSKWELMEQQNIADKNDEDIDGMELESEGELPDSPGGDRGTRGTTPEEHDDDVVKLDREMLREIELKVIKLQDELESGKRERKPGLTIMQQAEYYRDKLRQRAEEKLRNSTANASRSSSSHRRHRSSRRHRDRSSRDTSRDKFSSNYDDEYNDSSRDDNYESLMRDSRRLSRAAAAARLDSPTLSSSSPYRRSGRSSRSKSPSAHHSRHRRRSTDRSPPQISSSYKRSSRSRSPQRSPSSRDYGGGRHGNKRRRHRSPESSPNSDNAMFGGDVGMVGNALSPLADYYDQDGGGNASAGEKRNNSRKHKKSRKDKKR